MKAGVFLLPVLWLTAAPALGQAQPAAPAGPATNSAAVSLDLPAASGAVLDLGQPVADDRAVGKHLQASGPLARPFKAKKLREVPRRVWHLFNPFAHTEPTPDTMNVRGLSPRAWTVTVGWHPGVSAFSDPLTHEPSLSLISLSRPQP